MTARERKAVREIEKAIDHLVSLHFLLKPTKGMKAKIRAAKRLTRAIGAQTALPKEKA